MTLYWMQVRNSHGGLLGQMAVPENVLDGRLPCWYVDLPAWYGKTGPVYPRMALPVREFQELQGPSPWSGFVLVTDELTWAAIMEAKPDATR